jgi:hypothetical protein
MFINGIVRQASKMPNKTPPDLLIECGVRGDTDIRDCNNDLSFVYVCVTAAAEL